MMFAPPPKYVYLAGPITGTTQEGKSWREYVSQRFAEDILPLSPTRDIADTTDDYPLTIEKMKHGKEVLARDRFDVSRCELLLVNLMNAQRVSIGTVGEVFWADAMRKPVVLVIEAQPIHNPHFHLMLLEIASWVFNDLDSAIGKINLLLSDCRSTLSS